MNIGHQTTIELSLSESEARDIISEINSIYEMLVADYHTPEEICSLLTLKNALIAELQ